MAAFSNRKYFTLTNYVKYDFHRTCDMKYLQHEDGDYDRDCNNTY